MEEPVRFLEEVAEKRGISDRVLVLNEGITRIFS
jgi:hypothetical protein